MPPPIYRRVDLVDGQSKILAFPLFLLRSWKGCIWMGSAYNWCRAENSEKFVYSRRLLTVGLTIDGGEGLLHQTLSATTVTQGGCRCQTRSGDCHAGRPAQATPTAPPGLKFRECNSSTPGAFVCHLRVHLADPNKSLKEGPVSKGGHKIDFISDEGLAPLYYQHHMQKIPFLNFYPISIEPILCCAESIHTTCVTTPQLICRCIQRGR